MGARRAAAPLGSTALVHNGEGDRLLSLSMKTGRWETDPAIYWSARHTESGKFVTVLYMPVERASLQGYQ